MIRILINIIPLILFGCSHLIASFFVSGIDDIIEYQNNYWRYRLGLISLSIVINYLIMNYSTTTNTIKKYLNNLYFSYILLDCLDRFVYDDVDFHYSDLSLIFIPLVIQYIKHKNEREN